MWKVGDQAPSLETQAHEGHLTSDVTALAASI